MQVSLLVGPLKLEMKPNELSHMNLHTITTASGIMSSHYLLCDLAPSSVPSERRADLASSAGNLAIMYLQNMLAYSRRYGCRLCEFKARDRANLKRVKPWDILQDAKRLAMPG